MNRGRNDDYKNDYQRPSQSSPNSSQRASKLSRSGFKRPQSTEAIDLVIIIIPADEVVLNPSILPHPMNKALEPIARYALKLGDNQCVVFQYFICGKYPDSFGSPNIRAALKKHNA